MFPGQIASLEQPLVEFLQAALGGTQSVPAPLLRGVYMTSGTQEGTPIDRFTGVLARAFGVDQTRVPSLQPVRGRSYFLERLLKEVIFGEAMLVSHGPAAARRRTVMRMSGSLSRRCWSRQRPRCWGRYVPPVSARSTPRRPRSRATNRSHGRCRWIPWPTTTCRDWRRCWTRRVRCRMPRAPVQGSGDRGSRSVWAVAGREARCLGTCRVPPRAGMGVAAAAGMATGSPDARQSRAP